MKPGDENYSEAAAAIEVLLKLGALVTLQDCGIPRVVISVQSQTVKSTNAEGETFVDECPDITAAAVYAAHLADMD